MIEMLAPAPSLTVLVPTIRSASAAVRMPPTP